MKGTYKYFLNDEPTGIIETFDVATQPDGKISTVSSRKIPDSGITILVLSTQNAKGFDYLEVCFQKKTDNELIDIQTIYGFSENNVSFSRQINFKKTEKNSFSLLKGNIIFPLMRCFQGETILRVAENKSVSNVLVPSIENPEDIENLLKPTFDKRTAEKIGTETINSKETGIYKYLSKHYSEDSRFWIDENGLLVKYIFNQSENQTWKIELS